MACRNGALLQSFGRANASGELPPDAPFWLRAAQYLIGVAMFAGFAMIGTWVAFAGDAHYFSGGIPFLGLYNISLARIAFGFGALICWLLIVEPHGFARLWLTGKEKLRLWPYPY